MILHGDSLEVLKGLEDNSIDFICTDPPYGYSFMGNDWDKAVPSVELWAECLRVLKPGAFITVMSAPRSDVQMHMIKNISEAGFRVDFTPIYWTYASGFPKAGNIGKLVDKRLGAERERTENPNAIAFTYEGSSKPQYKSEAISSEAMQLNGSYAGFQPKPAVEVIIVAMKPLSEKTYVDQALKNGKGISWLDDGRIGTGSGEIKTVNYPDIRGDNYAQGNGSYNDKATVEYQVEDRGRFPANLLVEDDILGDYSKFFSIDKWAETLPFLQVAKAPKSEKNKGLEHLPDIDADDIDKSRGKATAHNICPNHHITNCDCGWKAGPRKNGHPTVKPLKLMSYLITLFSRPGDTVLDPFCGSGTTCVAAKELGRDFIGVEREAEYVEIAKARIEAVKEPEPRLL